MFTALVDIDYHTIEPITKTLMLNLIDPVDLLASSVNPVASGSFNLLMTVLKTYLEGRTQVSKTWPVYI